MQNALFLLYESIPAFANTIYFIGLDLPLLDIQEQIGFSLINGANVCRKNQPAIKSIIHGITGVKYFFV